MSADIETTVLEQRINENLRQARRDFLVALEPERESLYRYCRSLTGTVWDAEDLLQDTLAKALADASQRHEPLRNPQAWLIRIATNSWLDGLRRSGRTTPVDWMEPGADVPDSAAPDLLANSAVSEALRHLLNVLPPRERACLVLKDVFAYSLAETAAMLDTTEGAVKSALHRARAALKTAREEGNTEQTARPEQTAPPEHAALLRRLTDAFNSYDITSMVKLFLASGRTDVVGNVSETGHEQIRTGSLSHTFGLEAAELYRASTAWFDGEEVILLWERPKDAPQTPEVVADVLRLRCAHGVPLIAELAWYFFCPEVLAEVAGGLGLPFKTNGVSYF